MSATVYFEIAVVGHGRSVVVTACGYRNITAQRDKRRSVCRSATRLQGSEQGFVGSDTGSITAYRHFIRNRSAIAPAGDFGSGQFHLGLSRLLVLFQREVEGEPLAAFETGLVTRFGSIQVGRYMIVPHILVAILAYGYLEPFLPGGQVLRRYYPVGIAIKSVGEVYTIRCAVIAHRTGQQVYLHAEKHRWHAISCHGVYQRGRQVHPFHALSGNQVDNEPVHQMLECQCHRLTLACCGSGVEQVIRVVPRLIYVRLRISNLFRDVRIVGGESHRFRLTEIFPVQNGFLVLVFRIGIHVIAFGRVRVKSPRVAGVECTFPVIIDCRTPRGYRSAIGSAVDRGGDLYYVVIVFQVITFVFIARDKQQRCQCK